MERNTEILRELATLIARKGGTTYLVGGATRDKLLDRPSKDNDLEVFGLEDLESVLREFVRIQNRKPKGNDRFSLNTVGKSFQVFKIRNYSNGDEIDISLPRRDRKVAAGHKGIQAVADSFMSVKDAASRRDFTINAIYEDVLTGLMTDPFGGINDLNNKVIKMVDENAFAEDPLRVLRALQFAARFQFQIDMKTWDAMQYCSFSELPAERIFTEIEKMFMKSEKPSWGLEPLMLLGFYKEMSVLNVIQQDPEWHPEGDVFTHTMMVVDEAARLIDAHSTLSTNLTYAEKLTVMLAALCHDFGKATTTEFLEGRWRARGHSEAGIEPTTRFLNRLNVHTVDGFPVRDTVLKLVEFHLFPAQLKRDGETNVPRALCRMSQKVRLDLLAMVSLADMLGRGVEEAEKNESYAQIKWFLEQAEVCQVVNKPVERILKGRDLIEMGMKPGKEMGNVLAEVFDLQLEGHITNLSQAKEYVHLNFGTQIA